MAAEGGETEIVGDLRWEAVRVYREASVAMRVYEHIKSRGKEPGDAEDLLLTDFQETLAARAILRPLDFLGR